MRILLHICCGPCGIMPIRRLLDEGFSVAGYFDNPNVQPLAEYLRRREGALRVAAEMGVDLHFPHQSPEYDAEAWCRAAFAHPAGRCVYCRESRFARAAAFAGAGGFDAFSSSLLYSRRQNHEGMVEAGKAAENATGVPFLYRDFRGDWQQGISRSREWGIHRQQYCGCLFSEQERYAKDLAAAPSACNEKS